MGQLVLNYIQTFIWPVVVVFALIKYRKFIETVIERVIESLASQAEVTIFFASGSLKIPLKPLVRSLEDNLDRLDRRELSEEQLKWLKDLRDKKGRLHYDNSHYKTLVPLRNAGLITQYKDGKPADQLQISDEVGITPLGKLLFEAWERNQKSH